MRSTNHENPVEPSPPAFAVPSLEALSYFTLRARSVMVAGPDLKNEIVYYMGISSDVLIIPVPMQVDYTGFSSSFL